MAGNIWLISDLHLGHTSMYTKPLTDINGNRLRPFQDVEEADEYMIQEWNKLVAPQDKVYVLGDVAIPRAGVKKLERLKGRKCLIAGNHDSIWEDQLRPHFYAYRAYWKLGDFALSHVPMHVCSLRRFHANIHGHLHSEDVLMADGTRDPRYINVCVEKTEYKPINYDEIYKRFREDFDRLTELALWEDAA